MWQRSNLAQEMAEDTGRTYSVVCLLISLLWIIGSLFVRTVTLWDFIQQLISQL